MTARKGLMAVRGEHTDGEVTAGGASSGTSGAGGQTRGTLASADMAVLVTALGLAFALVALERPMPAFGVFVAAIVWILRDLVFRWETGVAGLLFVLFFVPSRIYKFNTPLPFDLDPYRLVLLSLVTVWVLASVLRGQLAVRRTHVDLAAALFVVSVGLSYVPNMSFYLKPQPFTDMVKYMAYILSFPATLYFVASVVPSRRYALKFAEMLVVFGAIEGLFALFERVTHYNVFFHLETIIPGLIHVNLPEEMIRGAIRVAGSTAHPIALATVLPMVLMLGLARTLHARSVQERVFFAACCASIALGSLLTLSRTAVVCIAVGGFVLLLGFPRKRVVLMASALGLVAATHLMFGGVIGTLIAMFSPSTLAATEIGNQNGRLEDYAWAAPRILGRPFFGVGYGQLNTDRGARVLDNQYLGLLIETGIVGFLAFSYLVWRAVSVPFRAARQGADSSAALVGFAAAASVFAISSATFDTVGFPQVTYMFFALAGLCAVVLGDASEPGRRVVPGREADRSRVGRLEGSQT